MKEYGDDFLKELRTLEKKERTLRNKVIKKMAWLIDNHDHPYLEGFYKESLKDHSTEMMIFVIKRVEDSYVSKSKQTNLFNDD